VALDDGEVDGGETLAAPVTVWLPEGLTNVTSTLLTPETSSATTGLTSTVPPPVKREAGVKLKLVSVGGVVSGVVVTVSVVGVNPLATSPGVSKNSVLPEASAMKTELTVQVPDSLNFGKVTITESVTLVLGVKLLEAL
jgi:hypothetical protein